MTYSVRIIPFGLALIAPIALGACASNPERAELDPSTGIGFLLATPATVEYPPYVVCNGDRCGLRDKDGNITQMSKEERNNYRLGIQLAEERAREGDGGLPPPPQAPPPKAPRRDQTLGQPVMSN
ncbi:MAG: hypothetical protein AAF559_01775 [Pseudomonadota bacterium]